MLRLVLRWLDGPWAFELMPGLNTMGRNPTNDFRLSDPSVSSFHAEIFVEGDSIRVRDLGSTNGTFIDGRKIDEAILDPGGVLSLGAVRMRLESVPVLEVRAGATRSPPAKSGLEITPNCAYHPASRAAYQCENCGGAFCSECVTVIGQDRLGPTTLCPVCKGQCDPLKIKEGAREPESSLLGRLSQTLKIPFVH